MARKRNKGVHPELSVVLTFLALITLGFGLLSLPFVRYQGTISLLDTMFMATSAVCVTGLVTVPTSGFNLAGQLVLLLLIQLGAIGIMTIGSSLLLVIRGELSLPQRLQASTITQSYGLRNIEGVLAMVLKYTLLAEGFGLAALTIGFSVEGYELADSLYLAFFHTISAFCNAGFSPFDTSLIGTNWIIKSTIIALIIMGGLGYYVVFELVSSLHRRNRHLTIHARAVLYGTLALVGIGWLLLSLTEGTTLGWLDGLFQSVTARTAGFNTVDLSTLHASSLFVLIILMIIGAAPGSTAGGVKLTTFLVMVFSVYNAISGRERVTMLGRRLPAATVLRAYALVMLYLAVLALGIGLLLHTEGGRCLETIFEVTSAMGTVGLSLGLTPELSSAGKKIIILYMFLGRIGPAILVLIFLRRRDTSRLDYPEEKIILG